MADTLQGSELAAYRQLKAGIESWDHLNKKQKLWLDETCLLRYLRARKFDVVAAKNMLAETLEWRFIDARPHRIPSADMVSIASQMSSYFHGHTANGNPVHYMRFKRDPADFSAEQKLQYMMFNLEEAVRIMTSDVYQRRFPGTEKIYYIIDLDEFSMTAPGADPALAKGWGAILGKHYPERLAKAYLLNYPGIFSTFWSLISVFIDPVTANKVAWAPKPQDNSVEGRKQHYREFFASEGITPDLLEDAYGGDVPALESPNFVQGTEYTLYPTK